MIDSICKFNIPVGGQMKRNTYGELLKSAKIGSMELKNRICMAPMDFKFFNGNTENSSMTHRQVKVFEERARGDVVNEGYQIAKNI